MTTQPTKQSSRNRSQSAKASRLSDTQLVILTNAVSRDDQHVLPLPTTLRAKGNARAKALESLITKGLIKECRAKRGELDWRKNDGGRRLTLKLTDGGLAAINAEGASAQCTTSRGNTPADRSTEITPISSIRPTSAAQSGLEAAPIKPGTKAEKITNLLHRKEGATIQQLIEATGWQAHSVRGFISGTLRKRLGLNILSKKDGQGIRRYRIDTATASYSWLAATDERNSNRRLMVWPTSRERASSRAGLRPMATLPRKV